MNEMRRSSGRWNRSIRWFFCVCRCCRWWKPFCTWARNFKLVSPCQQPPGLVTDERGVDFDYFKKVQGFLGYGGRGCFYLVPVAAYRICFGNGGVRFHARLEHSISVDDVFWFFSGRKCIFVRARIEFSLFFRTIKLCCSVQCVTVSGRPHSVEKKNSAFRTLRMMACI